MESSVITDIIARQRRFFAAHTTRGADFRLHALETLRRAVLEYEDRLYDAFWLDLRKSRFEAYATEIGMVLDEIRHHRAHLRRWMKPQRVPTPLTQFPARSRRYPEPYGVVLIMAPWNYPFMLLIEPLIGAISAGNCVVLKAADYSRHVAAVMEEMIRTHFQPEYICLVQGGRSVNQSLLREKFDYIFFTGSPTLGSLVMQEAAKTLTPVSLELGGKSPCIVDRDADIPLAARRIAWGKFLNGGQTCVAPDYLFVHQEVKAPLLTALQQAVREFFGPDPADSPDYPRIISEAAVQRLTRLMQHGEIVCGGQVHTAERYIAPTIIDGTSPQHPIMQEEIFGPLLPVMTFERIDEVIEFVNARPKPLALYYFSRNPAAQEYILARTSAGGACINDVVVHLATPHMPFGGVGDSGMGGYHGKFSFDTFSHWKSVLKRGNWLDIPLRYAPFGAKLGLLKKLLR